MTGLDFGTRQRLRQQIAEHRRQQELDRHRAEGDGTCKACGTVWSVPTPGCKPCSDRERRRAKRRLYRVPEPPSGKCYGCGTPWKGRYTVGCEACATRRLLRKRAA